MAKQPQNVKLKMPNTKPNPNDKFQTRENFGYLNYDH